MTELKPCPFCGGEAYPTASSDGYGVECRNESCLQTIMQEHSTEAEAIAAWNTRTDYHGYEQAAIEAWENIKARNTRAERTCHAELNAGRNAVVCSECGSSMLLEGWEELIDWGGNVLINTFKTYPYCLNCGARVISDNEPVEVWQQASADDVTCYGVE